MEHCGEHSKLMTMVKDIHNSLVGTLDKKGLITRVRTTEDDVVKIKKDIANKQASKNGLLDWTFRTVIGILLGFIAMKVGLK